MATSPRVLSPAVRKLSSRTGPRATRQPKVPFSLIWKPWAIQPCCTFPVLPGETLTSTSLQMQFWSDPLKAKYKNTPWTFEYFCFYTPFRAMPGWGTGESGMGEDLQTLVESGTAISSVDADGNALTYCPPGGADYLLEQTKAVAETFFREAGQAWDAKTIDGLPAAHSFAGQHRDVFDKLIDTSQIDDRTVSIQSKYGYDMDAGFQDFLASRDGDLAQSGAKTMAMDYEDIIRAMGGKARYKDPDREELHRTEMLCYLRHWDYPVNTVEPSTGVPAVAFGHRFRHRYTKAFRFNEPGWVSGFVLVRPKVFWKNQQGLFSAMMLDRDNWFMPNEDGMTSQSHLNVDDDAGPLKALTGTPNVNYSVDLRDLLMHGEGSLLIMLLIRRWTALLRCQRLTSTGIIRRMVIFCWRSRIRPMVGFARMVS